jgi:hypothetical protein
MPQTQLHYDSLFSLGRFSAVVDLHSTTPSARTYKLAVNPSLLSYASSASASSSPTVSWPTSDAFIPSIEDMLAVRQSTPKKYISEAAFMRIDPAWAHRWWKVTTLFLSRVVYSRILRWVSDLRSPEAQETLFLFAYEAINAIIHWELKTCGTSLNPCKSS